MIESDIKQQLINDGVDIDANIKLGIVPSTPDNVIVIATAESVMAMDEYSLAKQLKVPAGIPDIKQTITVTVRNTDYGTGQSKIWSVYNDLVGLEGGFKLCNSRQMFIVPVQPPHFSREESGKQYFLFNILVTTKRDQI